MWVVCLAINCLKDIWQIRWFVRIFLNIYCINRVCMDDGIHNLFVYRICIYIVKLPLTLNNIVLGRFFRAGGFGGPFRLRQFWKNIREKFPAESLHELLWPEVLLMTSVIFSVCVFENIVWWNKTSDTFAIIDEFHLFHFTVKVLVYSMKMLFNF